MPRHTTRALAALLALAPAAIAWKHASDALLLQPQSRLWVDGSSTMRRFTCKAGVLETDVRTSGPGAVGAVLGAQKAVSAVTVTVPAQRLECGNGTMNDHMFKALKAREHEAIAFKLVSYEVARQGDGVQGTLTGTLTLGGVQQTIAIPAMARPTADGGLRVTGAHELSMKAYGLKAPTLMMGTLKVDDRVTVNFDLTLKG